MSDNYLYSPWVIFIRKEAAGIDNFEDLKGRKVSVPRGYVIHRLLERREPEIELLVQETSEDSLLAVSTGKADAYIDNLAVGSFLIANRGIANLKVLGSTPFGDHNQAMVTRKECTL